MLNHESLAVAVFLAVIGSGVALADNSHGKKSSLESEYCPKNFSNKFEANKINFQLVLEIEPLTPGFAVLEGPVWVDDALLMSHIGYATGPEPSPSDLVVLRDGVFSVLQAGYGANGLTYDAQGFVVAGRHLNGSVTRVINGAVLADSYEGIRFNSPNDLVFSRKGHLYVTDPNWQAPDTDPSTPDLREMPQADERAYHITPDGQITAFAGEVIDKPNGVMLSLNENNLYVGGTNGLFKYTLNKDGSVVKQAEKIDAINGAVDGMSKDCAGNLYVASDGFIHVLSNMDKLRASYEIPGVTNVAFGGEDAKTIYVTSLGEKPKVFSASSNIPGFPF